MSNLEDIRKAFEILVENGTPQNYITILHCNTEYPTPMLDVNLKAMLAIKEEFNVNIGYSDHTLGIEVPIAAVSLGAKVIEKHFTLDKKMEGPDHSASLNPLELKLMVDSIRNIELALSGNGFKEPTESEKKNIAASRKSVHISKKIHKGKIISKDNIMMRRPGDGISPMEISKIIGGKVNKNLEIDHKLSWDDLIF